jgi:phosphoglycerol transferase MdoB-like AlkP superfamily enzyme
MRIIEQRKMTKFKQTLLMFTKRPVGLLLYRLGVVMILFTVSRLLFYLFNQKLFPQIDIYYLFSLCLAGLRFDLTSVIYFNLAYIFLLLIPHKLHHYKLFLKATNILFYTTNGIAFFLNSADFVYYRFTNRRTTFIIFEEFANEKNFGPLLYNFAIDYYYVPLICGALIFLLFWSTKNQQIIKSRINGWKYFIYNSAIMTMLIPLMIIGVRGGVPPKQDFPLNPSDAGQYVEHPNDIAIVLNTPFTMILSSDKPLFPKQHYFTSEAELDSVYTPVHQADTSRKKRRINVVVIMVESLGSEPIGFYNPKLENGNYAGYTPFLDSLCKHAYVFINSYANSRISIEGSPAVIASIPSLEESYTVSLYSGNKIMSLAACLKNTGYDTYYFHGAPNGSLGLNSFANIAGFDKYYGKNEYNNNKDYDGVWGIWDHNFLPFVVNSLENQDRPFFSFVYTATSHHPYKIPESFKDKFREGTEKIYRSISYADYSLKLFFDAASKKSWFNNTIFVITGDHTCMPHHDEYKTDVGAFTVPIIFYEPGSNLSGIDSISAQQIDIMPTILNYLGYPEPYFAFGQDLFENNPDKFAVSYRGNSFQIIHDNWVLHFNLRETTAIYNIGNDKEMKINLIGKVDPIQNYLERQIKAFIQQYNNRLVDNNMIVK